MRIDALRDTRGESVKQTPRELARMKELTRKQATRYGIAAIVAVNALQAFNGIVCYHMSPSQFFASWAIFILIPLVPALVSLLTANPLRAVGASVLFAPWLVFAYYTDCIRPYTGGGASMVYVAVLMWGTPSAIVGALVTGPVLRLVGVRVGGR